MIKYNTWMEGQVLTFYHLYSKRNVWLLLRQFEAARLTRGQQIWFCDTTLVNVTTGATNAGDTEQKHLEQQEEVPQNNLKHTANQYDNVHAMLCMVQSGTHFSSIASQLQQLFQTTLWLWCRLQKFFHLNIHRVSKSLVSVSKVLASLWGEF